MFMQIRIFMAKTDEMELTGFVSPTKYDEYCDSDIHIFSHVSQVHTNIWKVFV